MEEIELYEFDDDGMDAGFTTVQNLFITHFMPAAKGNYVKVYLAGLMRCYGNRSEQWASAATIAEEQQMSAHTVRQAWRYWESVGLVRRVPRYLRDPKNPLDYRTEPDTIYCHQSTNIIRFRRDLRPLIEQSFGGMQDCIGGVCSSAQGGYAELHTKERQVEERQVEERQDRTRSGPVIGSETGSPPSPGELERARRQFELYVERPPSKSEERILERLVETYGVDWVEAAFTEYDLQRDLQEIQAPIRYVEGVLRNWSVEGARFTDVERHLQRLREEKKR